MVLASFSGMAQASTGNPACPCLGALPDSIPKFDCTYDFAPESMKCVELKNSYNWTIYPGDYGEKCKVHKEPGAFGCYDLSSDPPTEKFTGGDNKQAEWCGDAWCYIDPCACDFSDPTPSDYFPEELEYSYETCESENRYTDAVNATNKIGSAKCARPKAKSSDAHTLKIGLGLLVVSMGTLMKEYPAQA